MNIFIITVLSLLVTTFAVLFLLMYKSFKTNSETKKTFHSIFDMANDPIFVVDLLAGNILECNQAASDLLGYSTDEIKTRNLQQLHPPEHTERSAELIGRVWRKQGLVYEDISLLTKNGTKIPVEISAKVIIFRTQQAVLLFTRDITLRLDTEQKIKNYTHDLETAYEELNDAQAKLIQSEKLASIGSLAAGVAHEINSPAGVINSNASISMRASEIIAMELENNNIDRSKYPRLSKSISTLSEISSSTLQAADSFR